MNGHSITQYQSWLNPNQADPIYYLKKHAPGSSDKEQPVPRLLHNLQNLKNKFIIQLFVSKNAFLSVSMGARHRDYIVIETLPRA